MDIHHCRSILADPPFYLSSSSCLSLPADTETNTLKNMLVSAAAGLLNVSEFANNLLDPSQHHGAAVISTVAIEQKSFGFKPVGLLDFFMWRLHVVPVMYLSGFSPGSLASSYSPKTLICNSELAVSNVMTLNSYVFLCFTVMNWQPSQGGSRFSPCARWGRLWPIFESNHTND